MIDGRIEDHGHAICPMAAVIDDGASYPKTLPLSVRLQIEPRCKTSFKWLRYWLDSLAETGDVQTQEQEQAQEPLGERELDSRARKIRKAITCTRNSVLLSYTNFRQSTLTASGLAATLHTSSSRVSAAYPVAHWQATSN